MENLIYNKLLIRGYNVVVDYDEELHEPTYIFSEEA